MTQIKTAFCPKKHNLIDNDIKIESMPTIKLKAVSTKSSGHINLDPIYGKNRHQYNLQIEPGKDIKT